MMRFAQKLRHLSGRASSYWRRALESLAQFANHPDFELRAYVVPGPGNDTLPVQGVITYRLSIPAGSHIVGMAAYSSQADGFTVNLVDQRYNAPFFQRAVKFSNAAGPGSTAEGPSIPFAAWPSPRLVIEPGEVAINLRNLAAAANTVELVLYTLEPIQ